MNIEPTPEKVSEYQQKWDQKTDYVLQESSLKKLFTSTYPLNNEMDDVLIKVCALNDFYSTNIFSPFKVAHHIVNLNIDEKLFGPDYNLVNSLALVEMGQNKIRNFYSFASKYCSHHFPEEYPIYDYYVEKVLLKLRRRDGFSNFKNDDLKEYREFIRILSDFRESYGLEEFDLKQIDRYLWLVGQENFPRKYY